jgi:Rrf2 family protein
MVSARVHYAALALVELSLCDQGQSRGPLSAAEISQRCGVPGPFLVQILQSLRSAGWVQSVRGSQGGYRLAVAPEQVTLLEVAQTVGSTDPGCQTAEQPTPADRLLHEAWDAAAEASRAVLARATIADIAAQCSSSDEVMFYI